MSGKKVSKKRKWKLAQCISGDLKGGSENKSVAILLAQLNTAVTLSEIGAALAEAKANGFSNKHETYKHAKRRLFALQTDEALEDLLAKEGSKKRKRSFNEDTAELELRGVKSRTDKENVSDEKATLELGSKEKKKKRRKEKKEALEDSLKEETPGEEQNASQLATEPGYAHKRQPAEHQVRIAGFPYAEDEESLRKYFSSFGSISKVELIKDRAERSRAVAFITFDSEEGCLAALEGNGQEYNGRYLKISKPASLLQQGSKSAKQKESVMDSEFKIIIAGLPYTTDPDRVQKKFAKCGEIGSFYMPIQGSGSKRGQSKGFALVTYRTQQAMDMALSHDGATWLGSILVVKRKHDAGVKAESPVVVPLTITKEFEVFVGGLYSIGRKVIKKHFAECGEVEEFEMPLTREGESKGIAFIAYKTKQAMDSALQLHETQLGKRWLTVERKVQKTSEASATPTTSL